jgi:hypothetical protein
MKNYKKLIAVLCTDGWQPEIRALTFPLFKYHAKKIGADFHVINTRAFPSSYPLCYERFQLYDISKNYDWVIQLDADLLLHPDTPDFTRHIDKDTLLISTPGFASDSYQMDEYFLRDKRDIGVGGFITINSDWTRDFWLPPDDLTPIQAMQRCMPKVMEWRDRQFYHDHIVLDYILSRNVAKFGLKYETLQNLFGSMVKDNRANAKPIEDFVMHNASLKYHEKIIHIRNYLDKYWKIDLNNAYFKEFL